VQEVVLTEDTIRLGQLLKLANLVESGSEAKQLLAKGGVLVNGEIDTRRGRQLTRGDVVSALDASVLLV